jgi:hypothetical protein
MVSESRVANSMFDGRVRGCALRVNNRLDRVLPLCRRTSMCVRGALVFNFESFFEVGSSAI